MSYIKINIGGKERGLKFNQMAMIIMGEKTDKENITASAAYALIYAGLRANTYVKSEEPDYTFEQVCDWVDLLSVDDIQAINNAFIETEAYKKGSAYVADLQKEKTKKKLPLKSTKAKT